MRVMLIGTDRNIFVEDSAVRNRIIQLGAHVDALDSIVFSMKHHGITAPQELAPAIHAYPTNSTSRLLYGWDALRIAQEISKKKNLSSSLDSNT